MKLIQPGKPFAYEGLQLKCACTAVVELERGDTPEPVDGTQRVTHLELSRQVQVTCAFCGRKIHFLHRRTADGDETYKPIRL